MNAKKFYEKMSHSDSGWSFKKFYDDQQAHRAIGTKNDFGCLIDTKKNKVEFWKWSADYDIKYSLDDYSDEEFQIAVCTCDSCGIVQPNESYLQLWNRNEKCCSKCVENNL